MNYPRKYMGYLSEEKSPSEVKKMVKDLTCGTVWGQHWLLITVFKATNLPN